MHLSVIVQGAKDPILSKTIMSLGSPIGELEIKLSHKKKYKIAKMRAQRV